VRVSAAAAITLRAVAADPVKAILATPLRASASPVDPGPVISWSTGCGSPKIPSASVHARTSQSPVAGVSPAGLNTTAVPAARASRARPTRGQPRARRPRPRPPHVARVRGRWPALPRSPGLLSQASLTSKASSAPRSYAGCVPPRPYVILSCATSADGYLDDASPRRLILSGPADLDRVDEVRAGCDADVVG